MKRIMWTVAMLPLIAAVFILQYMPDSVPMHYNASGSIDRWGSKYEILILPASILGVALLFQIIIMVYEKKISESSDEKDKIRLSSNLKVMKIVSITVSLVFGVMCGFIMYNTWSVAKGNMDSQAVDMMKITAILMGVMLIVLGNFMPKTKRNHMVGMRIKWSLYNDITWRKSNLAASIFMMIAGFCTIVTAIFTGSMISLVMLMIYLSAAIIGSLIYSYGVYKKEISAEK